MTTANKNWQWKIITYGVRKNDPPLYAIGLKHVVWVIGY